MNWIAPSWLWLSLPLLAPIFAAVVLGGLWHRRKLAAVFGVAMLPRVLPASVRIRRTLRDLGALACMVLGCIALAEPAFDKEIVQIKTQGVDLVIALDLSRSMNAEDVDPSRLERARREIIDLLDVMEGDRVGLVFYAGQALPRLPLTQDHRAVEWVLADADPKLFTAQGSALGKAIDVARELLGRDEGKAGKAIIVLSDGETHDPEDALRAANDASAEGTPIYAMGIGERESPIPNGNGGFFRRDGKKVMTKPDFGTLREVARITGGGFVNSVPSASDVQDLYTNAIRASVRAAERETQQTEKWNSAYQYPLVLGIVLWLAGAWLGEGRRRYGAAVAVLLAVSLVGASAQAATRAEADELYRAHKYRQAAEAFEELALERPGDADLYERLGATRYRMGDYVAAAQAYEEASRLSGGSAAADYAAGNARYRAGQLEEALQRYGDALQREASHERAKQNRDLVVEELAERRAEKPPEPDQQGSSEDQQGEGQGDSDEQSESSQESQGSEDGSSDAGEQGDPDDSQQDADHPQGDPQDSQPNPEGSPDGDPQDSEGQDPSQGNQDGDPRSSSDESPEQGSESTSPDELDGAEGEDRDGEPQDQEGGGNDPSGIGEESGNITPAQASRMLDGVEEGRPRVRVTGRSSEKPW